MCGEGRVPQVLDATWEAWAAKAARSGASTASVVVEGPG